MYNFDEIIDRRHTNAMNTDGFRDYIFHADETMKFPYQDEEFIRMWVADMEFATPDVVIDGIKKRLEKRIFGYTRVFEKSYYDAFAAWCKSKYDWTFDRKELVMSNGIIPALFEMVEYICKPDEKVLFLTPSYAYFKYAADASHRESVCSDLINTDGYYTIDYEDLEKKAADEKTTLFILCNPHNPSGRVWKEEELKKIGEIIEKNNMWVISDEIHCDLIRRGVTFTPIMNVAPEYADHIVVCTAPSKTFNLAGMKTSNIVIHNKELQKKWKDYVNGSLSMDGASALGMTAMIAAYTEGEEWLEQLKDYLDGNFAYIDEYLKKYLPKAHLVKAEGTYLAWIDLNGYVDRDEKKLEELMQKKAKVALDEGYIFGEEGRGFERINVASPRSVIEECMNRIRTAFEEEKLV